MTRDPICAHCNRPALGSAWHRPNPQADPIQLCYPDWGLNCYKLVTIAGHDTPCEWCRLIRIEQDSIRSKQEDLLA